MPLGRPVHKGYGAGVRPRRVASLLEAMDPARMTDAGMYAWAGLITVGTLVASYFVAVWWQRRKDSRRRA